MSEEFNSEGVVVNEAESSVEGVAVVEEQDESVASE